jgi:hypothetical protein
MAAALHLWETVVMHGSPGPGRHVVQGVGPWPISFGGSSRLALRKAVDFCEAAFSKLYLL